MRALDADVVAKDVVATATTGAAVISSLAADGQPNLRVYVHYPFCPVKCAYCAFPSTSSRGWESEYLRALLTEVRSFTTTAPLVSLYFGGGSPGLASVSFICEVVHILGAFASSSGFEISMELRPEDMLVGQVHALARVGVNRISLGVQSFIEEKRKALGRSTLGWPILKPPNHVAISMDLIVGTVYDDIFLDRELSCIARCRPNHVSVYPLSVEHGSAYYRSPPGFLAPHRIANHYSQVCRFLVGEGYTHYSFSNFAREESAVCHHNMGYWLNEDYVGLGVAAHSKRGCMSLERDFDIARYVSAITAGSEPPVKVTTLTSQEYAEETLLMGLRLLRGFPISRVISRASDPDLILEKVNLLSGFGAVTVRDEWIQPRPALNFERCLRMLGWGTCARLGWRRIAPARLLREQWQHPNVGDKT